jgi:hypothetical protein
MAALQGYLLLHKENAQHAIDNVNGFVQTNEHNMTSKQQHDAASTRAVHESSSCSNIDTQSIHDKMRRTTKRKPITAFELDKMFFNPQKGSGFEIQ